MKLYSYWRSSTSYRVRAALNLKGLSYEIVPVDLVAGDQRDEAYLALNPGAGVPTLVLEDGTALTQSLAILDYLEAMQPQPRLIPVDPSKRARVLAAAPRGQQTACPRNTAPSSRGSAGTRRP